MRSLLLLAFQNERKSQKRAVTFQADPEALKNPLCLDYLNAVQFSKLSFTIHFNFFIRGRHGWRPAIESIMVTIRSQYVVHMSLYAQNL